MVLVLFYRNPTNRDVHFDSDLLLHEKCRMPPATGAAVFN